MRNKNKENILLCKSVKFYCNEDEDAFFEWINKINCIDETTAEGKELYLHVRAQNISDNDLDDIIGLFYRYKIEM